jgi:hypothetical protein
MRKAGRRERGRGGGREDAAAHRVRRRKDKMWICFVILKYFISEGNNLKKITINTELTGIFVIFDYGL